MVLNYKKLIGKDRTHGSKRLKLVKRAAVLVLLAILTLPIVELTQFQLARANPHAPASVPAELIPKIIIIRSDGSVDPSTDLISQKDNFYTLTSDLVDCEIWINYNGAVIDGAGHHLKTQKPQYYSGITLNSTTNVTVKNLQINGFQVGVVVQQPDWAPVSYYPGKMEENDPPPPSKNNFILNCTINGMKTGVFLKATDSNTIAGNLISGNWVGIQLQSSAVANKIENNTIIDNGGLGIQLARSSGNTVAMNIVSSNGLGILVEGASNNKIINNHIAQNRGWAMCLNSSQQNNEIYGNNFIDNNPEVGFQVSIPWYIDVIAEKGESKVVTGIGLGNNWDSNAKGNYWSDFKARYPNATEKGDVWDTTFWINENNMDSYPLVTPLPHPVLQGLQVSTEPTTGLDSFLVHIAVAGGIVLAACITASIYVKKVRQRNEKSLLK